MILIIISFTSCTVEVDNSVTKKSDSKSSEQNDTLNTQFIGNWETDCLAGTTDSTRLKLTFNNDGAVILKEEFFYDTNCSTADETWTSYHNYEVENSNISFERYKELIKPQHADRVTDYNQSGSEMCDINDWQINITQDVTGLDCDSFTTDEKQMDGTYVISNGELTFTGHYLIEDETFIKQ